MTVAFFPNTCKMQYVMFDSCTPYPLTSSRFDFSYETEYSLAHINTVADVVAALKELCGPLTDGAKETLARRYGDPIGLSVDPRSGSVLICSSTGGAPLHRYNITDEGMLV